MTVLTLLPNGTISNSLVITGGVSPHTVWADSNDATYASPAGTAGRFGLVNLTDVTLPAGAVTSYLAASIRQSGSPAPNQWQVNVFTGATLLSSTNFPASAGINWLNTATLPINLTDSDVDAMTLQILALTASGNVYDTAITVVYVAKPTLNVATPTGTLTTTNVPLVTWANTLDVDGGSQTTYEVKVYSAAQYGAGGFSPDTSTPTITSGIVSSAATQWQPTVALANATYRAYVRVAQTVNGALHWSAWDFEAFVINVTAPSAPTLTATAQSTQGRIKLTLDDNGALSTDRFELQRSLDGGATWVPVRIHDTLDLLGSPGIIVPLSTAAFDIYDYEAPNGTLTSYRARALHNYSGLYAASAWTSTQTATWTSTSWWIKDPEVPLLNMDLGSTRLTSYADVNRAARQGVFQALGATVPIVVTDTRGGATGSIILTLLAVSEQNALLGLLNSLDTLLLQGPAAHGMADRYVRFGDHASARAIDKAWSVVTRETLTWIEVAAPDGPQTGAQVP